MKLTELNRMRQLAGLPLKESQVPQGYRGPYTFNTAEGGMPLYVETDAIVDKLVELSAMAEEDELDYWGGIELEAPGDPDDEFDEIFVVSVAQMKKALSQARLAADEDGTIEQDEFFDIWQDTLGLR